MLSESVLSETEMASSEQVVYLSSVWQDVHLDVTDRRPHVSTHRCQGLHVSALLKTVCLQTRTEATPEREAFLLYAWWQTEDGDRRRKHVHLLALNPAVFIMSLLVFHPRLVNLSIAK